MAYSKQTWDTTSYVNPTRMNHIENGIAGVEDTLSNNKNVFSIASTHGTPTAQFTGNDYAQTLYCELTLTSDVSRYTNIATISPAPKNLTVLTGGVYTYSGWTPFYIQCSNGNIQSNMNLTSGTTIRFSGVFLN